MKCRFCGEPAGFMKTQHPECLEACQRGKEYIRRCIDQIYDSRDCMNIDEVIAHTASHRHIPNKVLKALLTECWLGKAEEALADGVITEDEISILGQMVSALGLESDRIWKSKPGKRILEYGGQAILDTVYQAMQQGNTKNIKEQVQRVSRLYGFSDSRSRKFVIKAWRFCIDKSLEDGVISKEEEKSLDDLIAAFEITQDDDETYMTKIVKSLVLRDVLNGEVNKRVEIMNDLPVILQRGEISLWLFSSVEYYEDRKRRQYSGGSSGISFRVAKGVYVRTGAFKGIAVDTTETVYVGTGMLLVTNKNLFWISPNKVVKIQVKKMIAITPTDDGVIVQKDGVTAKPQYFKTRDAWFTYNLISNLHLLPCR